MRPERNQVEGKTREKLGKEPSQNPQQKVYFTGAVQGWEAKVSEPQSAPGTGPPVSA